MLLSICTPIRLLAAHCTENSLASTEAEVPSGYTGVDLAAHFGPCGIRLGFISFSQSHLSKKNQSLNTPGTNLNSPTVSEWILCFANIPEGRQGRLQPVGRQGALRAHLNL